MKVSLIISTYNWPGALERVLASILIQSEMPHEVIVADDGSTESTRHVIDSYQQKLPCSLIHVWHPDTGFLVSTIRNKAAAQSTGDYLVYIDGDCVLRKHFIRNHRRIAKPGCFVTGNRILLNQTFTEKVLAEKLPIFSWRPFDFSTTDVNRRWALFNLPFGWLRRLSPNRWQGVKTCNVSFFKKDFVAVNGFDETYRGWGLEDSDLAVRMLNQGLTRLSGRFAVTVMHLWHSTSAKDENKSNLPKLKQAIEEKKLWATEGINQYLTTSTDISQSN